jgi:hypothetical protein
MAKSARCRKSGRGPDTAVQVREAGKGTGAYREEMGIAMSNVLALMRWHNFRFLQNFSNRDFAWLLIGAALAVAVMWIISRRRRR